MTEKVEQPYTGGLNLIAEELGLHPTTVPDAMNVEFGAGGRIKSRKGDVLANTLTPLTAMSASSRDMYVVEEDVGVAPSVTFQLIFSGGRIYRAHNWANSTISTVIDVGGYTTSGAYTSTRPIAVAYVDAMVAAPAITKYTVAAFGAYSPPIAIKSNTTGVTIVTHTDWTAFNGYPSTCAAYSGRMWYAGVDGLPSRLYATDVGTFGTFGTATGADKGFTLDMQLVDGGRIIGMKHLYDMLLVFTTRGIYRIVTDNSTIGFRAIQVTNHVAVSQHAIVEAENSLYYMTRAGVFKMSTALTYGDVKSEEVSAPIAPMFEATDEWELSGAFGVYDGSKRRMTFFFQNGYTGLSGTNPLPNEFTLAEAQNSFVAHGIPIYPYSVSTAASFSLRSSNWTYYNWPFYIDYAVARDRGDGNIAIESYTRKDATTGAISTNTIYEYELLDPATAVAPTVPVYARTRKLISEAIGRRKTRTFIHSYVAVGNPGVRVSFDDGAFTVVDAALPTGRSRRAAIGSGTITQFEYYGSGNWEVDAISPDTKMLGRR